MATKALGKRTLDARPDRPDMRDRLYAPPLKVLPPSHPPQEWIETLSPEPTRRRASSSTRARRAPAPASASRR